MSQSKLHFVKKRTVERVNELSSDEVVEVEAPAKKVGKSRVEKRNAVIEDNTAAKAIVKQRIMNAPRYLVQKQSLLWRIGNFSEYKSGVVNGNAVVCEKCVDKEDYLFCEISLGKDFSTSPLKNHLYAHHRDLYEEYIRQTTGSSEDSKTTTESQPAAGTITAYLEPAEKSPRYYIAKMIVMKYLPLSFIEDPYFRDVIHAYNRKAEDISTKKLIDELISIKQRLKKFKESLRSPGEKSSKILQCKTELPTR